METISVIIPVFNNGGGLKNTIESLKSLRDPSFEILVADDGSASPVEEITGCTVIRLEPNSGPGKARNQAAKYARGSILAFTDSDCTVDSSWLERIREVLGRGNVQAAAGGFEMRAQTSAAAWLRCLESAFHHLKEEKEVDCFTAANFAIRRETFERCGGFPNERVGEDLLLGLSLRRQGASILWAPQLKVSQEFRSTAWAYFKQQFLWSAAVMRSGLRHPEIFSLRWPVKRNNLHLQLAFLVVLIPASILFPFFLLPGAALFLLFNGKFLSYASARVNAWTLCKLAFLILAVRNPAWLCGVSWAAIENPKSLPQALMAMLTQSSSFLRKRYFPFTASS